MNIAERWHNQTRQVKNVIAVFLLDLFLLLTAVLAIPGLKLAWETLTSFMPDIYEPIFLQLVAALRGASPGSVVASGAALSYTTTFLTMFTVHALIAFGIGYLFQKLKPTIVWSIVNYGVLILVLFVMHLTLILKNFWFVL